MKKSIAFILVMILISLSGCVVADGNADTENRASVVQCINCGIGNMHIIYTVADSDYGVNLVQKWHSAMSHYDWYYLWYETVFYGCDYCGYTYSVQVQRNTLASCGDMQKH